ncbi:hypothetical protein ACLOJK_036496 [Asimina triloba]
MDRGAIPGRYLAASVATVLPCVAHAAAAARHLAVAGAASRSGRLSLSSPTKEKGTLCVSLTVLDAVAALLRLMGDVATAVDRSRGR